MSKSMVEEEEEAAPAAAPKAQRLVFPPPLAPVAPFAVMSGPTTSLLDLSNDLLIQIFGYVDWIDAIRSEAVCRRLRDFLLSNATTLALPLEIQITFNSATVAEEITLCGDRKGGPVFTFDLAQKSLKHRFLPYWLYFKYFKVCQLADLRMMKWMDQPQTLSIHGFDDAPDTVCSLIESMKYAGFTYVHLARLPASKYSSIAETLCRYKIRHLFLRQYDVGYEEEALELIQKLGVQEVMFQDIKRDHSNDHISSSFVQKLLQLGLKDVSIYNAFTLFEKELPWDCLPRSLEATKGRGFTLEFIDNWFKAALFNENFKLLSVIVGSNIDEITDFVKSEFRISPSLNGQRVIHSRNGRFFQVDVDETDGSDCVVTVSIWSA